MNEENYVSPLELNATDTIDDAEAMSDDGSEMADSKPMFVLPPQNSVSNTCNYFLQFFNS